MSVVKILKFSFVMSAIVYGLVAFLAIGVPDWNQPLVPANPGMAPLFYPFAVLALVVWAVGFTFGRLQSPPAAFRQARGLNPWPRVRFILGAAFIEAGAIFGLVLSFVGHDSRPGIVFSAVAAVLLLLLPAEEGPASN
jgi:F0F1-type ATP synthase membrane subunit c/vacuolar-type H+-ATPase subunit K